jgi:hypothetical protein
MVLEAFLERVLSETHFFYRIYASGKKLEHLFIGTEAHAALRHVIREVTAIHEYRANLEMVLSYLREAIPKRKVPERVMRLWEEWLVLIVKVAENEATPQDELNSVVELIHESEEPVIWEVFWKWVTFYMQGEQEVIGVIQLLQKLPEILDIDDTLFIEAAMPYLTPVMSESAIGILLGVAHGFGIDLPNPRVPIVSSGLKRPRRDYPRSPHFGIPEVTDPNEFAEHLDDTLRDDMRRISMKESLASRHHAAHMTRYAKEALRTLKESEPALMQHNPDVVAAGHWSSATQHMKEAQRIEQSLSTIADHSQPWAHGAPSANTTMLLPVGDFNQERVALTHRKLADQHLSALLSAQPSNEAASQRRQHNRIDMVRHYRHHVVNP